MSENEWKRFERLVAAIHHTESQGAEVKWNDVIEGRQFDVTIRFKYGMHDYLSVIECKNYSGKVPVEKLDALVTKSRDVKANKAIMVSSNGYQSGCIDVANRHGIKLLTLKECIDSEVQDLIKEITPSLNIFAVRFVNRDTSEEFELEDVGGRLSYLMNHIKLKYDNKEVNLNRILNDWQLSKPDLSEDKETDIEIQFNVAMIADIPYETTIPVKALRFKCSLIDMIVPNRPVLDNHIRTGLATKYELRDVNGNLEHAANLTDLELGYDSKVEVGKYYVIPSLSNYYYCESIESDLISWILVESYQYGHLIRARLKQKDEYSGHYVEVKDKRILNRLRKLHGDLNNKR